MFARCREVFDEYYRLAEAKKIRGFRVPLGLEAKERLEQMDWLLTQIRSHEDQLSATNEQSRAATEAHIERLEAEGLPFDTPIPPEVKTHIYRSTELMFEIRLLVECFYYFAARARGMIRDMPELNSFEAAGVRDVRNHLIEHPEGRSSQVLSRSFGFGGPNGPIVKALRDTSETAHPDGGLYANAHEFALNLETALKGAIGSLVPSQGP